jgi:hypothetical protein
MGWFMWVEVLTDFGTIISTTSKSSQYLLLGFSWGSPFAMTQANSLDPDSDCTRFLFFSVRPCPSAPVYQYQYYYIWQ